MPYTLTIQGNLGSDGELRYTPNGKAVYNVGIATNREWTSENGEKHKEVTWFTLELWGERAETANKYWRKGMPLWVEARLKTDGNGNPEVFEYEGRHMSKFKCHVKSWNFISGGNGSSTESYQGGQVEEDEIPF